MKEAQLHTPYGTIHYWTNEIVEGSPSRECYIDGIWNKEDPADWLTELQLPVE